MFLPTTAAELRTLGWDALDVILVTGDAYIDSPFVGVAVNTSHWMNRLCRIPETPASSMSKRLIVPSPHSFNGGRVGVRGGNFLNRLRMPPPLTLEPVSLILKRIRRFESSLRTRGVRSDR